MSIYKRRVVGRSTEGCRRSDNRDKHPKARVVSKYHGNSNETSASALPGAVEAYLRRQRDESQYNGSSH